MANKRTTKASPKPAKKKELKTVAYSNRDDVCDFVNNNNLLPGAYTIVGSKIGYTIFYY